MWKPHSLTAAIGIVLSTNVSFSQSLMPRTNETPSFDCSRAKAAPARLICADGELAGLDGQLGAAFQHRRSQTAPADQQKVVADQLKWIRERNKKCGLTGKDNETVEALVVSKSCMVAVIRERISFLNSTDEGGSKSQTGENQNSLFLGGDFGSLSFAGQYSSEIADLNITYRIKTLTMTFMPNSQINSTNSVDVKFMTLSATKRTGEKVELLFTRSIPVTVPRLDSTAPIGNISDITFEIPISAVEAADHVGIAVSDGRWMWPISTEFKRTTPQQAIREEAKRSPVKGTAQSPYALFQQLVYAKWSPPPGAGKVAGVVMIDQNGLVREVRFYGAVNSQVQQSISAAITQSAPLTMYIQDAAQSSEGIIIGFEFDPALARGRVLAAPSPPANPKNDSRKQTATAPTSSPRDFARAKISHVTCNEGMNQGVIWFDGASVEDGWVSTKEALTTFGAFAVDLLYAKCNGNPGSKLAVIIDAPPGVFGTWLKLMNRNEMLTSYGSILAGFSFRFRGEEWYAADQDNKYWERERERIAQRQEAERQRREEEQAQRLRANVGNKEDIIGFRTGGDIASIREAAQKCTVLEDTAEAVKYGCAPGQVIAVFALYLTPKLVAIVKLDFCDPKDGPAVAADVAQQFGILQNRFQWVSSTFGEAAKSSLGFAKRLELFPTNGGGPLLPLMNVPGHATGCPANHRMYSIQVVDDGVIERNTSAKMAIEQEKQRRLMSTPTTKF
jgi:uncharacterized protein YecT (DUF1311 family)